MVTASQVMNSLKKRQVIVFVERLAQAWHVKLSAFLSRRKKVELSRLKLSGSIKGSDKMDLYHLKVSGQAISHS